MTATQQISTYLSSLSAPKRAEMEQLHERIVKLVPGARLWYHDGTNEEGKVVSNPNIGYGEYTINYADGTSREFFRIGLSANTAGISVYVMGLEDKNYLHETYGERIGKAKVTGYCIRFKKLADIDVAVLMEAVMFGLNQKS